MTAVELVQASAPVTLVVIYAMLGWVAEVVFAAVTEGEVTNRGFLAGPYCPIYGFGALAMTALLLPVADNPILVFLGAALLASLLELVTGWVLEKLFHRRWWDYSDRPFNIGGYICLQFSLMWGVVGVLLIDVLHPLISRFLDWLNPWVVIVALGVIATTMLVDLAATVSSTLKLDDQLKALKEADEKLRASTTELSTSLGEHALELKEKADDSLEQLKDRREVLNDRLEALPKLSLTTRRQLRAFPQLRSTRYPEQLRQLAQSAGDRPAQPKKRDGA